jgi:periplasmic protein TonB
VTASGRMSTLPPANSSFLPAASRRRIWGPMLVAFAVEALILAVVVFWLAKHSAPPTPSSQFAPIRLDITKPPTPDPAPTAPAKPTPEMAKPTPKQPTQERTAATTPSHTPPQVASQPSPAPLPDTSPQTAPNPSSSASSDFTLSPPQVSAAAGPPLPAPPKGNGQVIDISEFQRQINTALHEAAHKMNVLRGIKMIGQVQLVVHYRDGKAWDPRILKSSGFPMLDHAVTDAVAEAEWPPPPRGLEGREIIIPIAGSFW